jgi:hypothetical protein
MGTEQGRFGELSPQKQFTDFGRERVRNDSRHLAVFPEAMVRSNVWTLASSLGRIRLELNPIHLDQTVTEVSRDSLVCSP